MRIDLSMIVGKYIGDTERNIRRLLDEAERMNAVLYFDEADELFDRGPDDAGTRNSRVPSARNALTSAARRRHITVITGQAARHRGSQLAPALESDEQAATED